MPRRKAVTTSPVPLATPNELVKMSFPDAVQKVIEGKKITKLEWNNPEYYGCLDSGFLMLHKPDGQKYRWTLSDGDLLGNDWIVI